MNAVMTTAATPHYRRVWRWHFYAGLFCIPFVMWLAVTGSIYLFKPQIDAWMDRDVDQLTFMGAPATAAAQVQAALMAVPESKLQAYELPLTAHSAVRVLVSKDGVTNRVYVHPQTTQVLKIVVENARLTNQISRLHGELMMGKVGSYVVEWAASWAIVMILTGLYLWWPRNSAGMAGVLYPRLTAGGRLFWRDVHGVVGFWVSAFALFLLVTGLPWTQFWGGNLKVLRQWSEPVAVQQDWKTQHGRDAHADHLHAAHGAQHADGTALDRVLPTAAALGLAAPVLIVPPERMGAGWTAKSDTQNRPLRASVTLDAESGQVVDRKDFSDRKILDRVIGTGVAAHEGQLFGWPNQLLGLLTALGLLTLCVSAAILWWRRRPEGTLGAPASTVQGTSWALRISATVLALLLPLMGLTLVLVLLFERVWLRRWSASRVFLGLDAA